MAPSVRFSLFVVALIIVCAVVACCQAQTTATAASSSTNSSNTTTMTSTTTTWTSTTTTSSTTTLPNSTTTTLPNSTTTTLPNSTTTTLPNSTTTTLPSTTTTTANSTTSTGASTSTTGASTTTTSIAPTTTTPTTTTKAPSTTASPPMITTTQGNATAAPNTPVPSTPTGTTVTVLTVLPTERPSVKYLLVLGGTSGEWELIVNNSVAKGRLVAALKSDLAGRFYTSSGFIDIIQLFIGSLHVSFSVLPTVDGTHVNEGAFMKSNRADNTWLKSTADVYATVSSNRLEVQSAGYANSTQRSPATHTVCEDGCGGFIAAGASVLGVVVVLVLWAWRRHSKEADEMEREKMERGGIEMSARAAAGAPPKVVTVGGDIFSNPRAGRAVRR